MKVNRIARIASLLGEPARAAMLLALMDGRALTANELARAASISPQTGSRHLALLVEEGLLQVKQEGRHRYHRFASEDVPRMLETIAQFESVTAHSQPARVFVGPKEVALRTARTCYDHLAGRLGVAIADRIRADEGVVFDDGMGYLTDNGLRALKAIGFPLVGAMPTKKMGAHVPCKACLDWSERRYHIGGKLGALISGYCLERHWVLRRPGSRALDITPPGQAALRTWLGPESWAAITG